MRWSALPSISPIAGLVLALASTPAGATESSPQAVAVTVLGDDGAALLVDDQPAGTLPLGSPLRLLAGPHRLRLQGEDGASATALTLRPGEPVTVRFSLAPPLALLTPSLRAIVLWRAPAPPALQAALAAGLATSQLLPVDEERVSALHWGRPAPDCAADPACLAAITAAAPASFVVLAQASPPAAAAGSWSLALSVYDAAVGEIGASAQSRCAACSAPEAAKTLRALALRVAEEASSRARGALRVHSRPAGATVRIDDRAVGVTPLTRTLFSGPHEVHLALPNHQEQRSQITVLAGQQQVLDLALRPLPPAPSPPLVRRRPRWPYLLAGGATALAVGLGVGLGVGLRQSGDGLPAGIAVFRPTF